MIERELIGLTRGDEEFVWLKRVGGHMRNGMSEAYDEGVTVIREVCNRAPGRRDEEWINEKWIKYET